ncbi:hypothetical protein D3C73_1498940 [compost metagenome]
MAQRHHRPDERLAERVARKGVDEGLVHLQRGDWKLLQVAKRGIACAEIVQRNADAP